MNILQFIFFIRILDSERLGETVAKIMACSGLQGFSVMHQRFNGIGLSLIHI